MFADDTNNNGIMDSENVCLILQQDLDQLR